jgi:hypothetical protein
MKKFEVHVKEVNHGYVIVEAESREKATEIALYKYHRGMAVMSDDSNVKTETIKEILPMGFRRSP